MARGFETENIPESDRAPGCRHPRETYDLIGHKPAETRFLQAEKSGRLHHAWLLTGAPGIGKATLAYRMARLLLGGQSILEGSLNIPESDPVSQRIESRGHGNLYVVNRPWDSKTKKFKQTIPVDIIDTADDLNTNAENALLKMLEEPPERTVMILLSSAPGRLLPTIRSRCMAVSLKDVPQPDIIDWLSKQGAGSADLLTACAKLSRGGPGKAIALAQNATDVLSPLKRFMESLESNRESIDMPIAKALSSQKAAIARELFWDSLEDSIQSCAVYSETGQWEGAFEAPKVNKTAEKWLKAWSLIREQKAIEAAINLDKTATMLNTLSAIRAA